MQTLSGAGQAWETTFQNEGVVEFPFATGRNRLVAYLNFGVAAVLLLIGVTSGESGTLAVMAGIAALMAVFGVMILRKASPSGPQLRVDRAGIKIGTPDLMVEWPGVVGADARVYKGTPLIMIAVTDEKFAQIQQSRSVVARASAAADQFGGGPKTVNVVSVAAPAHEVAAWLAYRAEHRSS